MPSTLWKALSFRFRQIFALIFGRWTWEAPRWLAWTRERIGRVGRALVADPLRAALVAFALLLAGGGTAWYLTRPTPHFVTYTVTKPGTDANTARTASPQSKR